MHFAANSQDLQVQAAWLDFLIGKGKLGLATEYWKSTASSLKAKPAVALVVLKPVLQHLLQAQEFREAYAIWQDLRRMQIIGAGSGQAPGELLFNGSFTQPILDCGFDWQIREQPFVSALFGNDEDRRSGAQEKHLVRIEFTQGHNADFEPLFQFVPLGPEREYELTALLRTEQIQSGSGPRIRVSDAQCRACLDLSTDPSLGTSGWHEQRLQFSVPVETRFLRISLWRPRSRAFPLDISGELWLKQVSLRAVVPATDCQSGVMSARTQERASAKDANDR